MSELKIWAIGVIACALAITVSEMLLPDGSVKKIAKVAFSLVLILVVLGPIVGIVKQPNYQIFKIVQQGQNNLKGKSTTGVNNVQENYYTTIIVEYEKKLDAYIRNEVKTFGGICKNIKILINRNSNTEKFGMVEMLEVGISGGDEKGLREFLRKTFILSKDKVIVRTVN